MLRDFAEIDIVGEAMTGRQAVERSRSLKPDVILMDLNMPEMGGIAATRAIKEEDPERVILALTVSEAEEDIVDMVAAGASGYVLKDIDPASLARCIQEAYAGRFQLGDTLTRKVLLRLAATLQRPRRHLKEPLTEREADVLRMLVEGKANKVIAGRLGVSEGTVKAHLRNIYRKLHVQTRAEAAARAVQLDA
jgi:DNA-binding NarL/FixJ family response regulator